MNDFPSSVSCVSELVEDNATVVSQAEEPVKSPTVYHSILKVSSEFEYRFPGFRPSAPLYSTKPDGTDVLHISFVYKEHDIPRFATMLYEVKQYSKGRWKAEFNPYLSTPQPHQRNGIEWIQLYLIKFEPALYALERALEEWYNLNMNSTTLTDGTN
jgi:hypothetical protein